MSYPWNSGDTLTAGDLNAAIGMASGSGAGTANVGRNLIHNSTFTITQRGSSGFNAVTTGWTYSLDRWQLIAGAAGDTFNHAVTGITDPYRAQIGDESAVNGLLVNFTGGAGAANACITSQFIEGVRRLAGKTVTVSFYAVAGSTSPKLGVSVEQFLGSGGGTVVTPGAGQSVTVSSTTWMRYSLTFAVPSISGKTVGTVGNDNTSLMFWHSAGANTAARSGNVGVQTGTHLIWGVQLEIGSVATPLEKLDPQQSLAVCERFYQVGSFQLTAYAAAGGGFGYFINFGIQMRGVPLVTPANLSYANASGAAASNPTSAGFLISCTATAVGGTFFSGSYTASADL